MRKVIYFDQAATTKPYPEVVEVVTDCLVENWGNPSSSYEFGKDARKLIEESRITLANCIGASPEEIFFTSGSTEGINWFTRELQNDPVYTTEIEHPAVIKSIANPQYVSLDKNTVIKTTEIPKYSKVMAAHVNNEIGTILPIKGIKDRNVLLFLDATQSFGHIPINVKTEEIDLMVVSGHKIHGIKSSGFLYASKEYLEVIKNYPMQVGGGQENSFRAGTENVAGIVALAKAAEISLKDRKEKNRKIEKIRNYLYGEITNKIPCAHLNGTANWSKRWCGNLNFRFDGYKGEELLAWFDVNHIAVSTGSACSSHSGNPSHVLKAIGLTDDQANSSIRFSFDETNTLNEAKEVYRVLVEGLEALRK